MASIGSNQLTSQPHLYDVDDTAEGRSGPPTVVTSIERADRTT